MVGDVVFRGEEGVREVRVGGGGGVVDEGEGGGGGVVVVVGGGGGGVVAVVAVAVGDTHVAVATICGVYISVVVVLLVINDIL